VPEITKDVTPRSPRIAERPRLSQASVLGGRIMTDDLLHCSGAGCPCKNECLRFRAVAFGRFSAFGTPPWDTKRNTCEQHLPLPPLADDGTIRERAYHLWLREGRPEGTAARDWSVARAELEAERRALLRDPEGE